MSRTNELVDVSLPFEEIRAISEHTRKELGITDELLRKAKLARRIAGWVTFAAIAVVAYAVLQVWGGLSAVVFIITFIGPAIVGTLTHRVVSGVLLEHMAPGVVEYEATEDARIKAAEAAFERKVKESTEYWCSLTGHSFEEALTELLRGLGFEAAITRRSGDGGVDIVVRGVEGTVAIQCKRYAKPVGPAVIRELYGSARAGGYLFGVLAVTGGVTRGVWEFIEGKPLCILGLPEILKMQMELNELRSTDPATRRESRPLTALLFEAS